MEDQIADRVEAGLGEGPGARGADAADGPEGSIEIQGTIQEARVPRSGG